MDFARRRRQLLCLGGSELESGLEREAGGNRP